ncbi:fumarylacetoacetate hydrolase family protein [Microbacterium sp. A196]|uniref:fumarylacetoacetate hydrolase family protein n=1 Tax=Microbacterium sp. A196 TaxID=3457320 RepID=UPI003FCF2E78
MRDIGLAAGTFGIGTFAQGDRVFPGIARANGTIVDVSDLYADTHEIFDDWVRAEEALVRVAASDRVDGQFADIRPLPPLRHPNVLQAGANYKTHVVQMMTHTEIDEQDDEGVEARTARTQDWVDNRAATGNPFIFAGLHSAQAGAFDDVILPSEGLKHDWELELAVVIGKTGRHVPTDQSMSLVAGYTIANDMGTLDLGARRDAGPYTIDLLTKNQPTFLPVGPLVIPARFVPDTSKLRIRLTVNGEVRQDESTEEMIFSIPELLSWASARVNLMPGDLLLTGSPAGNGGFWNAYLQDDDVIESSITGLGYQRNRCVREATAPLEWR